MLLNGHYFPIQYYNQFVIILLIILKNLSTEQLSALITYVKPPSGLHPHLRGGRLFAERLKFPHNHITVASTRKKIARRAA